MSNHSFEDYQILGLPYLSTPSAFHIRQAFHQAALRYHPDKNPDPEAAKHYMKIVQAYKNLTAICTKSVESESNLVTSSGNRFGNNLWTDPPRKTRSKSSFSTTVQKATSTTCEQLSDPVSCDYRATVQLGTADLNLNPEPKFDIFDEELTPLQAEVHQVSGDYQVLIPVTLEDLYHGRSERTYQVIFPELGVTKYFDLKIHAGWSHQIRFIVPTLLNEEPVKIHFGLEVLPHSSFTVEGDDLVYHVGLGQVYCEEQVQIKLLEGSRLTVTLNPDDFRDSNDFRISNKGLPRRLNGQLTGFGDLIIRRGT